VLKVSSERGLIEGKTIGVDATTLEANGRAAKGLGGATREKAIKSF
jgi:hypothetical protein